MHFSKRMIHRPNVSKFLTSAFRAWVDPLDAPLTTALIAIGVISIVSMAGIVGTESTFFTRHVLFWLFGLGVMASLSWVNWRYLKNHSAPVLLLYGIGVSLLLIALVFPAVRGSSAWIAIGPLTFEPSELMKIALVVLMAKYLSQRHVYLHDIRYIIGAGVYVAIPLGLILLQPDLGSAVILASVWFIMLLAAGIRRDHLFLFGAFMAVGAYTAWLFALASYQKERILAFINPYADPQGYGYNIIQSKIALGSGGLFGKGWGEGTQATLGFLPEAHNDFIFSAIGEQFGLVGLVVLLVLISIVLLRILSIGERAQHNFVRLFTVGFAAVIGMHVFIGAGVNVGLLPVTGIPLTFLSYGGSHMLSMMVGLGLVQSMKRYS
ncbi:MAG: FtsW/RodA/SpoVE family cell cycle protein [Patescibacteria group bacterium]